MTSVTTRDQYVHTERGKLFARTWLPASAATHDRSPILLFHDSLGCVDLWRDFPEKLAATNGRPVIAYDRLGFGRSDSYPGVLGLDFVAEEAEKIVPLLGSQLAFKRFVACGHSVGGGMAIATAAQFPQHCAALVTIGAQAFVERQTLEGIRLAKAEFAKPENLARLTKYHGDKAKWVVNAWIETWLDSRFAGWNLDDAIAQIRCPVLAIHGDQDEYGSINHPHRIAGKRGQVEVLAGVGHVPYRENAPEVLGLMQRFLSGI